MLMDSLKGLVDEDEDAEKDEAAVEAVVKAEAVEVEVEEEAEVVLRANGPVASHVSPELKGKVEKDVEASEAEVVVKDEEGVSSEVEEVGSADLRAEMSLLSLPPRKHNPPSKPTWHKTAQDLVPNHPAFLSELLSLSQGEKKKIFTLTIHCRIPSCRAQPLLFRCKLS